MTAPTADGLEPGGATPVAGWSRRLSPPVFLALSVPTFSHLLRDDMSLETAAIRCLVALVAAVFGMQLLENLVASFTRAAEPEPAPPASLEAAAPEPPPARRADDPDSA